LALVAQWADEIEKMADGLSVIKHHGPSRTSGELTYSANTLGLLTLSHLDPNALRKVRVVVTTYDVVKSEYMAHVGTAKDESQPKSGAKKKKAAALSDDENSDDSVEHFGRTVAAKARKSKAPKKSALFQVKWWRIVLGNALMHPLSAPLNVPPQMKLTTSRT
jgi:SNF2 family DNA or RNA helicase